MGRLEMLSFHYRREKDRKIERLRFTFTPNGIRTFVPREQVYPLIVLNYLLLQFHASFIHKHCSGKFYCYFSIYSEKFST